jgi:hypothetical protein
LDPDEAYWALLNEQLFLDDRLWQQAIAVGRRICNLTEAGYGRNRHYTLMLDLLYEGIFDHSPSHRPWDSSTRSMRYTAVLGGLFVEVVAGGGDQGTWLLCSILPSLTGLQGARLESDLLQVQNELKIVQEENLELSNRVETLEARLDTLVADWGVFNLSTIKRDEYVDKQLDNIHQRGTHHRSYICQGRRDH